MKTLIALCVWLMAYPALAAEPEPSILNPSGLPVPRYVSLKSGDVNVRVGPGKRYPIKYIYKRKGLPVKIVEEFAHWRKIADYEGTTGWVHKGMVDGRRTAMIVGKTQTLYDSTSTESDTVMQAKPLVIGKIITCEPDWCQMEINSRKGWIRKPDIWGVGREEVLKE